MTKPELVYCAAAVAVSLFYGAGNQNVFPAAVKVEGSAENWLERFHFIWTSFIGSLAGWAGGYYLIFLVVLAPATAASAPARSLGVTDLLVAAASLFGMTGLLTRMLVHVYNLAWERALRKVDSK